MKSYSCIEPLSCSYLSGVSHTCLLAVVRTMADDLVLDTAIRDWVLIPLSVVMVLIGVLRYFVSKLIRSSQSPDVKMVKEGYSQFLMQ